MRPITGNSQYQIRSDFLTSFVDGRKISSCFKRRERKYTFDGALDMLRLSAEAFKDGRLSADALAEGVLDADMISSPGVEGVDKYR